MSSCPGDGSNEDSATINGGGTWRTGHAIISSGDG